LTLDDDDNVCDQLRNELWCAAGTDSADYMLPLAPTAEKMIAGKTVFAGKTVAFVYTDVAVKAAFDHTHNGCKFLSCFVGADKEMQSCLRHAGVNQNGVGRVRLFSRKRQAKSGVVSTIRGGGLGTFDLTTSDLECLNGTAWLNDEVSTPVFLSYIFKVLPLCLGLAFSVKLVAC